MTTTTRDADDYLAKAQESLASAESDLAAGRYNSCMNRCYFGCFQAAISVLVRHGIVSASDEHQHRTVQGEFNRQMIQRRKQYPAHLADSLSRLITRRHQADYKVRMTSQKEAQRALARARDFVRLVTAR